MKRTPSYRHIVLNRWFSVIGARTADLGNCFVCQAQGDTRERMFLNSMFEMDHVERDALFAKLRAKETKCQKAKETNDRAAERRHHARLRKADEAQELRIEAIQGREYVPDVDAELETEKRDTRPEVQQEEEIAAFEE